MNAFQNYINIRRESTESQLLKDFYIWISACPLTSDSELDYLIGAVSAFSFTGLVNSELADEIKKRAIKCYYETKYN